MGGGDKTGVGLPQTFTVVWRTYGISVLCDAIAKGESEHRV